MIHAETRLVLVDAIVMDKRGAYVRDLAMKDFRVWEDNKEQTVKTFSFEGAPATPASDREHYILLLFDDASIASGDQMNARQAAARFLDKNTGPNRHIAIAEFTGTLKITQNFTTDAERLKKVVGSVRQPVFEGETVTASSPLSRAMTDFQVANSLGALRALAQGLARIPGRKTIVLFSAGFMLDAQTRPELTAAIDACNKANVAVYPIDARGLVAPAPFEHGSLRSPAPVRLIPASYAPPGTAEELPALTPTTIPTVRHKASSRPSLQVP